MSLNRKYSYPIYKGNALRRSTVRRWFWLVLFLVWFLVIVLS